MPRAIAERIRCRTEATVISLAPGITDRITVSIGIAMAPPHGIERVAILRVADEALYQAKSRGRNQGPSLRGGTRPGPDRGPPHPAREDRLTSSAGYHASPGE